MFGLFKKNKFQKELFLDLEEISKTIVVVPNTSETFQKIEKELKENGAPQELVESAWPLTVAHAISVVAEHDINFIFKNFNVRQGSLYCISSYITNLYNNGRLNDYQTEQPEMHGALKLLWQFCGAAASNIEFERCVIVPAENPFPD